MANQVGSQYRDNPAFLSPWRGSGYCDEKKQVRVAKTSSTQSSNDNKTWVYAAATAAISVVGLAVLAYDRTLKPPAMIPGNVEVNDCHLNLSSLESLDHNVCHLHPSSLESLDHNVCHLNLTNVESLDHSVFTQEFFLGISIRLLGMLMMYVNLKHAIYLATRDSIALRIKMKSLDARIQEINSRIQENEARIQENEAQILMKKNRVVRLKTNPFFSDSLY